MAVMLVGVIGQGHHRHCGWCSAATSAKEIPYHTLSTIRRSTILGCPGVTHDEFYIEHQIGVKEKGCAI